MFLGKSIINMKKHIATVQKFIQHNQLHYWKMYHHHNANRFWGIQGYEQTTLQRSQIQTRILKILFESQLTDIRNFSFKQDIRKQMNLDSLSITVLISSIEQQFNEIFEQDTYDNVNTLQQVVDILLEDKNIS